MASIDIAIAIVAIELLSMGFTNDWHHLFPLLVSWKRHSPNACNVCITNRKPCNPSWTRSIFQLSTPCWHKMWISTEPSNLAKVESCATKAQLNRVWERLSKSYQDGSSINSCTCNLPTCRQLGWWGPLFVGNLAEVDWSADVTISKNHVTNLCSPHFLCRWSRHFYSFCPSFCMF